MSFKIQKNCIPGIAMYDPSAKLRADSLQYSVSVPAGHSQVKPDVSSSDLHTPRAPHGLSAARNIMLDEAGHVLVSLPN